VLTFGIEAALQLTRISLSPIELRLPELWIGVAITTLGVALLHSGANRKPPDQESLQATES
jgi:hypothetical protein